MAFKASEFLAAMGSKVGGTAGGLLLTAANGFGVAANYTDAPHLSPKLTKAYKILGYGSRMAGANALNSGLAR